MHVQKGVHTEEKVGGAPWLRRTKKFKLCGRWREWLQCKSSGLYKVWKIFWFWCCLLFDDAYSNHLAHACADMSIDRWESDVKKLRDEVFANTVRMMISLFTSNQYIAVLHEKSMLKESYIFNVHRCHKEGIIRPVCGLKQRMIYF